MKRWLVLPILALAASTSGTAKVTKIPPQNVASEASEHPRIAAAVRELEDAIQYMEKAPHDFGGHKAEAIRASREALIQLRKALAYRAKSDRRR